MSLIWPVMWIQYFVVNIVTYICIIKKYINAKTDNAEE